MCGVEDGVCDVRLPDPVLVLEHLHGGGDGARLLDLHIKLVVRIVRMIVSS